MKKDVRVGLVGSGFAAELHRNCYARVPGITAEIVGVYSKTSRNREQFAHSCGAVAVQSFAELLEIADVIDVCVPGAFHEHFALEALRANRHVILEKPFTGYYGPPGVTDFQGDTFSKEVMLRESLASADRMLQAEMGSAGQVFYAENWIYAPAIQKEVEVLRATGGQILWAIGEESHSGSHSPDYGIWRKAGGGSLVGKSCHPLTAVLYLKRIEGLMRSSTPILPASVSCRTHEITRNSRYIDQGHLRTSYEDVEDYAQIHVVFEDGMVADIFASELVLGGVKNRLEVMANNHRTICNLSFTDSLTLYNPREEQLKDVYVVEKIGTKQGWTFPSPDEEWMFGYPQELADFIGCVLDGTSPQADSQLGWQTTAVLYAAYLSNERDGQEVKVPRPGVDRDG